jgi:hypothetical protein
MAFSAQKTSPTTQHFIGIEDIVDDIVVLPGRQACQIIEVTATNFSLQSAEEQQIKIISYASLLNSLSFPIQIVILSRKLDISSYLALLDNHAKNTTNPKLSEHIVSYRSFVADLVKNNDVLDKKFYISIPYSFLEKGAGKVGDAKNKNSFIYDAKNILGSKSLSVMQEISRIGLKATVLRKNELIKLFYEIFNQERLDEKIFENFHETHVQGGGK